MTFSKRIYTGGGTNTNCPVCSYDYDSYAGGNGKSLVAGAAASAHLLAAGGAHTCAISGGGAVMCWGANSRGQLGNHSNTDSNIPVAVSGLSNGVVAIAAGTMIHPGMLR